MDFYQNTTQYQLFKRQYKEKATFQAYYKRALEVNQTLNGPQAQRNHLISEYYWYLDRQPYFKIYPTYQYFFDPHILTTSLKGRTLLLRFPIQENPCLKTVLAYKTDRNLLLWFDFNETDLVVFRYLSISQDLTFQQAIDLLKDDPSLSRGENISKSNLDNSTKLVLTLLALDKNYLEFDVLNKYREQPLNPTTVDKSIRRGKNGYNIR